MEERLLRPHADCSAHVCYGRHLRVGLSLSRLLGHQVEPQLIKTQAVSDNEDLRAPNLPPLNHSQVAALRSVLEQPLSHSGSARHGQNGDERDAGLPACAAK